jgi:hypothetical protein
MVVDIDWARIDKIVNKMSSLYIVKIYQKVVLIHHATTDFSRRCIHTKLPFDGGWL